jgi:dihydrofolate synthase/folylpolyglutamate synthase
MADLEERSPAPLVLVAAMLATKDAESYLGEFKGLARELIAVPMAAQMAARPADDLASIANRVGLRSTVAAGIEAALDEISETVFERPPRVLICGSLYLAGEVLALNGTPPT